MELKKEKLGVSFDISPNGFHINIIFSNPTNCLFSEVSHLESGMSLSKKKFFLIFEIYKIFVLAIIMNSMHWFPLKLSS